MTIYQAAQLLIVLFMCSLSSVAQNFSPEQVEIGDTILVNSIKKYQSYLVEKDVMVIAYEQRNDTVKYYITSINSSYLLFYNIPLAYTKIANRYVLLYSGLERVVKMSDSEKSQFMDKFKAILRKDLLPDGKTLDPKSISLYDPMQVVIVTKNGHRVYEDTRKGFGGRGIPYLNNRPPIR